MECAYHPTTASVGQCISCGQPVCGECIEQVAGHTMCKPCVEATRSWSAAPEPAAPAAPAPYGMQAPVAPAPYNPQPTPAAGKAVPSAPRTTIALPCASANSSQ